MAKTISTLILGILLGSALMFLLLAQEMEDLMLEKAVLLNYLVELRSQNEKLNEAIRSERKEVITNVELEFNNLNESLKLSIIEEIRPLINELRGKPTNTFDPELITAIFDNRQLQIEDKIYVMYLKQLILLDGNLQLYLDVKEHDRIRESE